MSLLKPPNSMAHPPHPQPPPPAPLHMQQRSFLGCEQLTEADMDSDSEHERSHMMDDEDAAIDVEADEEQESASPVPSATSPKSSLCLESKESAGQHKELAAPPVDKSGNQKAY
ncbi:uncharacterized protein LOC116801698 [Drosophila sechellia]|uniref:uncharacterized protein LOC116801698 n=1 Tax=Drosophila sechellia TaxID=7238 RepID=UPI0013DDC6FB|nr:uncharacterized protein LOC116801698 [Drosophila sechellia]